MSVKNKKKQKQKLGIEPTQLLCKEDHNKDLRKLQVVVEGVYELWHGDIYEVLAILLNRYSSLEDFSNEIVEVGG